MLEQRKILSKNIRKYRKLHNMSQSEFAEECGICKDTLSMIECNKISTTIDTVDLIAAGMGVEMADLFSPSEVRFFLMSTEVTIEDITATTYGIGAIKDDIMIDCVPDISTDREKILDLVRACNEGDLAVCHLKDVVEDALR